MPDGLLLSAIGLLQKSIVDAVKDKRETRKEDAQLLRAVRDAVQRILTASISLQESIEKGSRPSPFGGPMWDIMGACAELETYFTRSKLNHPAVELLQPWVTHVRLSPAMLVTASNIFDKSLNLKPGVYSGGLDSAWEGLQQFSKLSSEVYAAREALTVICAEMTATAVMLEGGTLDQSK